MIFSRAFRTPATLRTSTGPTRCPPDENPQGREFPQPIVDGLRKQGHNVLWVRTDRPGTKDAVLLERAESEDRIILTLDKDFWQIALQRPIPLRNSGVILFRVIPAVPENLEPLVRSTLGANLICVGHVSIVTKDGIEMISLGSARN
jgi:predicted nuclease of predicted toxin-antitoxin system